MSNGYQRLCHQHKKFIQYSGGFRPVAVWHGSKANMQNPETTRQNLSAHRSEAGSRFALVAHMFARKYFSFVFAHSSFLNPQVNANPSSANYLRLAFYWRFKPSFHLTQWEFLASAHIFSIIVNLAKIKKSFFFIYDCLRSKQIKHLSEDFFSLRLSIYQTACCGQAGCFLFAGALDEGFFSADAKLHNFSSRNYEEILSLH